MYIYVCIVQKSIIYPIIFHLFSLSINSSQLSTPLENFSDMCFVCLLSHDTVRVFILISMSELVHLYVCHSPYSAYLFRKGILRHLYSVLLSIGFTMKNIHSTPVFCPELTFSMHLQNKFLSLSFCDNKISLDQISFM